MKTFKRPRFNLLLDRLSFGGLCISTPCLSLALITYVLFKELRTLPGVNLMNHSLLLAIKATDNTLLCTVVAILLHYFY